MQRNPIDYGNTHVEKIVCKDTNINSVNVGHTTDFAAWKSIQKKECIRPNNKSHNRFDWNNWEMVELETRCCESSVAAREVERDYFEQLNPDLNAVKRPVVSLEERKEYKKEWAKENKKHIQEQKRVYHWKTGKFCDKVKTWPKESPERRKEQAKTYRVKHKENSVK